MPKFTIKVLVVNAGAAPVKAHVGASLVGADWREYYSTSEDITRVFSVGNTLITRYLTSDLGALQKYDLVVALWEGEKTIGQGTKYATATLKNAVEKKKKIAVNLGLSIREFTPKLFFGKN